MAFYRAFLYGAVMFLIKIKKLLSLGLLGLSIFILIGAASPPPQSSGLTNLNAEDFQKEVKRLNDENLKQSLSDYKNFDRNYNSNISPDTSTTNDNSALPNNQTSNSNTNSTLSMPTQDQDNNETESSATQNNSNSNYYFQPNNQSTKSSTNTNPSQKPSGFNPYGTGKKE